MMDDVEPERDDAVLAGEYVLHLLDPAERATFEARLDVDGALRAEVALWADALADLAADVRPVDPPARVRAALERMAAPATDTVAPTRRGRSIWARLGMLGAAAAIALAVFVGVNRDDIFGLSPAIYIAQMQSEDTAFQVLAGYHPDEAALVVNRSAGDIPPGRVLELWLIAPGADAPVSLGVLPDDPKVTVTIPEDLRDVLRGSTLALSDEPPGGSPTGAPTGSVLAAGALADV
ncbi:anti-sigma factor [Oceaniglobus indicus]|uniref:anti-sigma factor n=1 Tax=Oceaniglobus indicus TaxID=2047749 RepID=UPI00130417E3|nr:anti-sigma factor [Oceaniglobus indicus]